MSDKNILNRFSAGELADALILKHNLSEKEKEEADDELAKIRKTNKEVLTSKQMLYAQLLQLRYQIEDYVQSEIYNEHLSFAYFLKKYIKLNYKSNKDFANDLNLKETALSLYLNQHRYPNDETLMRIDIHSGSTVPILLWNKLVEKEKQHALLINKEFRQEQSKFVKNILDLETTSK